MQLLLWRLLSNLPAKPLWAHAVNEPPKQEDLCYRIMTRLLNSSVQTVLPNSSDLLNSRRRQEGGYQEFPSFQVRREVLPYCAAPERYRNQLCAQEEGRDTSTWVRKKNTSQAKAISAPEGTHIFLCSEDIEACTWPNGHMMAPQLWGARTHHYASESQLKPS